MENNDYTRSRRAREGSRKQDKDGRGKEWIKGIKNIKIKIERKNYTENYI